MLIELQKQIENKEKIENRIKELEKEIAKYQRESSILTMQLEENLKSLNKFERKLFVFNKENKMIELEEKIRKSKSKYQSCKYQLNLYEIELNKLNQELNNIKECEIKYDEEINNQINLKDTQLKMDYLQLVEDNKNYKEIIELSNKFRECLREIDIIVCKGRKDYNPASIRYTLGNTTWILGDARDDMRILKKEIVVLEDKFKDLMKKGILVEEIERYFVYSTVFFDYTYKEYGIEFVKPDYTLNSYAMKVIDFRRDISNVSNKIIKILEDNLIKEKELRIKLEEEILKNDLR